MPKYNIEVQITGDDGNAFVIMSKVRSALKSAGASESEISLYTQESTSGDYSNLLNVASQWVDIQ